MKRAFSYRRFSTGRQSKGDSLARQTEGPEGWCKRNNVYLDTSLNLNDCGVSGFGKRNVEVGRLGAFLKAVESGRVRPGDFLIVENLDRLTRNEVNEAVALFLQIINAGVEIVTLAPTEVIYRQGMEPMHLMYAVMELSRGNAESARKSGFSRRAATKHREMIANGEKVGGRGPLWLRFDKTLGEWVEIPERVEIVRRIFRMALRSGRLGIAKTLNAEGVKTWGKAKLWSDRDIDHIIKSRAAFGEFRSHQWEEGFKSFETPRNGRTQRWTKWRVPVGDPVANYYPAAVTRATWERVQRAIETRFGKLRKRKGRRSTAVGNLFGGLLRDVRNGEAIRHVVRNTTRPDGGDRMLTNAENVKTRSDDRGKLPTFSTDAFEAAVLSWLAELKASQILGTPDGRDIEDQIAALEGQIRDLDELVADLRKRIEGKPNATLLDMIVENTGKRDVLAEELEKLRAERHYSATDSLRDVQTVLAAMKGAKGAELLQLRAQVAVAIRDLISSVWLVIHDGPGLWRYCFAEVTFRQGGVREVFIATHRGEVEWTRTDLRAEEAIDFTKLTPKTRDKMVKAVEAVFDEQAAFDEAFYKLRRRHRRSEAGRTLVAAVESWRRGERRLSDDEVEKLREALRDDLRADWLRKLGKAEAEQARTEIAKFDAERGRGRRKKLAKAS